MPALLVALLGASQGESGTFFRDEMIRLRDIDTSYSFRDFCSQVRSISGSMGQLLFHRSKIVDAIIESLDDSSSVAWPSVLELTGVLARDLREELYPEVPRLVRALAKMLDPSKVSDKPSRAQPLDPSLPYLRFACLPTRQSPLCQGASSHSPPTPFASAGRSRSPPSPNRTPRSPS